MLAVVPNCEEKGVGKAIIVQRLYMLLEQTTDNRDREESERSAALFGGSGAGLSVAGGEPLQKGKTEMKRLMSTVSSVLGQVAYEMEDGVLPSQLFWGFFVDAAGGEARGAEEERGGAVGDGVRSGAVPEGLCEDAAVWKNVPEEFPGCELYDFLYCNTVLFEGEQQQ
ncbi:uncharacterized protein MONOS_14308 [Monocercomonoides exilis]|uniref:uncharacterized protein n=1 Tax=Monocercomonoides exilis TaxID=2049356 RepID=UPI003559DCE2|nr:hypothetical protein MONOS_14308 [Monocercomonoides exilis]|eukprot:MONOS_14308.1-p1 / transcript=MONOS_14308.1 / gene=MONOS_14308 / organism=Monocercomonoides_exilis_PA203 / gene_product=unspecified product / transcript_product=unspecified product / location=Mono_scaffold00977:7597-8269(+) / protein_length=168 / sequence_SO=supercontig / SO=protein_coding / is_pseudo=false